MHRNIHYRKIEMKIIPSKYRHYRLCNDLCSQGAKIILDFFSNLKNNHYYLDGHLENTFLNLLFALNYFSVTKFLKK